MGIRGAGPILRRVRRHGRHLTSVAALCVLLGAADADAARFGPAPGSQAAAWSVPLLSLSRVIGWITSPFAAASKARAIVDESLAMTALAHEQGWTALRFDLAGDGLGVYLAVDGEAEFDVAYVDYLDGTQDRVALERARRGDGVFALAEFDGARPLARVSVLARAVSPRARVAVLIGR